MLLRTDPFRESNRRAQQVFGTRTLQAAMPMAAWLPGREPDRIRRALEVDHE